MFRFDLATYRNRVRFWIRIKRIKHFQFDVAAQLNIRPTTGHVRRNCHGRIFTSVGDNLCFLLVLTRVQNVMFDPGGSQHNTQLFGFLD